MAFSPFDPKVFQAALTTNAVGRFLEYRSIVDTTMVLARRSASQGAPHGSIIVAEEQTAGRGRQGRSFFSPPGENLYFTLVLRGRPAEFRVLPIAVPLAVALAIESTGLRCGIKWPNDIWIGGRKVSGILIDSEDSGGDFVALPGIGINVNTDFSEVPELKDTATSLRSELGHELIREEMLAELCNSFEELLSAPRSQVISSYRERSVVLGFEVVVARRSAEPFVAMAEDIEEDGALSVRLNNGTLQSLHTGDVSLRPT